MEESRVGIEEVNLGLVDSGEVVGGLIEEVFVVADEFGGRLLGLNDTGFRVLHLPSPVLPSIQRLSKLIKVFLSIHHLLSSLFFLSQIAHY